VSNGLLAPKGTSQKVIQAFGAEIVKMNRSGPVRDTLVAASYEPGVMSPQEYGAMIDRELDQWGAIVRETGVQIKS
jgi:tripartite-type tricarboxylate transporter receptor subunit TctC